MNVNNFQSITAVFPVRYLGEESAQSAKASVKVDKYGGVTITIQGTRHSRAFMDMILNQQMTGFTVDQQPAQKGFPGDNVEVTMGPPSEAPSNEDICMLHVPIQHRDGREPWCRRCGLNKDFEQPSQDILLGRPPQIGESLRKYEESQIEGP